MKTPFFPIDFDTFQADLSFEKHVPGEQLKIADSEITLYKLNHPGDAYGFRVQQGEKSVVYSSDAEHPNIAHGHEYDYLDFIRCSNLLIFDAPYTHSQSITTREHWGHSSYVMGVELSARAGVEKLAIFHHDPNASDKELTDFHAHSKKFLIAQGYLSVKQNQAYQEHHLQEVIPMKCLWHLMGLKSLFDQCVHQIKVMRIFLRDWIKKQLMNFR